MTYLLDTSACVDYLRRPDSILRWWLTTGVLDSVRLCTVVRAELMVGAWKKTTERNRRDIMEFLELIESVPFDNNAADAYGKIRADLEQKGQIIGPYDLQIAAVAVSRGATLVTGNEEEFQRVPGLTCLPLKELAGKKPL